jgi:RNA polymerase sigma-70 factor (ECF subfamily)
VKGLLVVTIRGLKRPELVVMSMNAGPGHARWAALYDKHKDAMWNAAYRELFWVGLGHLADDAVSEAMISLMKTPPPDAVHNWGAFMAKCAMRRAQDLRRAATGKAKVDTEYAARDYRPDDADFADDLADSIDNRQLGATASALLGRLSEDEQFALVECKVNGRLQADVAKDLGVSRGRVSQLCTAALEKLATMMQKEGVQW